MNRLKEIEEQISQQSAPPVHLWKPDNVGEIDILIDSQGFWFHEGSPIAREKLAQLFSSILWREDGKHYLVTPAEKLLIKVADAPFIIHQMEKVDKQWIATTNMHEQIIISADNPVELRQYKEQWLPYVKVRYDLWARVNRSIYYQWVSEAMEGKTDEAAPLLLTSKNYTFEVARI